MLDRFLTTRSARRFDAIGIHLASPEMIRDWAKPTNPRSFNSGEVKKPETINYRTFKPERDGLFCEAIFGPVKDWECYCGKYKGVKHKDVVCERCGVEVTKSDVRRRKMGYIQLAAPVTHIWFFRGYPSYLSLLMDMSPKELERVIYYEAYLTLDPGDSPLDVKEIITDEQRQELLQQGYRFRVDTGAAAVKEALDSMSLEDETADLEAELAATASKMKQQKIRKRLTALRGFQKSGNHPSWMIIEALPVMPPELRPLVALDGGRFASSDLNDLYRRIINRNNRLRKLSGMSAPELILRNERRMLQESVDAIIDNGKHGREIKGHNNRPMKSLSVMLKGKQGRFRQNLLGKRVDYSGRSVIVVGPELKLHQCGLPKKMALDLFKPFVIRKLQERDHNVTIKHAKNMVEDLDDEVWEALEEVIEEHPVLLNRAPTLHRLGIQAFQPHLVEGKAIRIHPLVCSAFNADFDGDQMAVHVPLSPEAQIEAKFLLSSTRNILKPAHGNPVAVPELDMVLGCNYLTKDVEKDSKYRLGRGGHIDGETNGEDEKRTLSFANPEDVIYAYDTNKIGIHEWVNVRIDSNGYSGVIQTTPGRVLFNQNIPKEMLWECEDIRGETVRLPFINREMKTKELDKLVSECFEQLGNRRAVEMLDHLKDIGFKYATISGLSLAITDFVVPVDRAALRRQAEEEVRQIQEQYQAGEISDGERYNRTVGVWAKLTEDVQESLFQTLQKSTPEQRIPSLPLSGSPELPGDAPSALPEGETATPALPNLDGQGGNGETAENLPQPLETESSAEESYARGFNPEHIMADSGARARYDQMRQISGMRGLMAKPDGSIIETPIFTSLREGLSVLEFFISTHGARKGLADTAIKTSSSGYLTRKLVDVAQDVIVTEEDCGAMDGVLKTMIEADEEGSALSHVATGRVAAKDILDPADGSVLIEAGELITAEKAKRIDEAEVYEATLRSPLNCEAATGVCRMCYGADLSTHRLVDIGEAVGIIAAQSIGEPGTQLTMRTFHTGGAATAGTAEEAVVRARAREGKAVFRNLDTAERPNGDLIALRNGRLIIEGEGGREIENRRVSAGSILLVQDGQRVEKETPIFREPDHVPVLTKAAGTVRFDDIIQGDTMEESIDEATGQRDLVITEYKDKIPRIKIVAEQGADAGEEIESYILPTHARLSVKEGESVSPGDTLARVPLETAKTSDIVSGLPRVQALFEASKPKDPAIITEIDGEVSFEGRSRNQQVVRVTPKDAPENFREYKISIGKFIRVQEGDHVVAGDKLTEGLENPHDLLDVKGRDETYRHLVREIKGVYRRQGERINDKHVEVIIRQMMRKVKITDRGDTDFLVDEMVTHGAFQRENRRILGTEISREKTIAIDDIQEDHLGGVLAEDVDDPEGGILAEKGEKLTKKMIQQLRKASIPERIETATLKEAETTYYQSKLAEDIVSPDGTVLATKGASVTKKLVQMLGKQVVADSPEQISVEAAENEYRGWKIAADIPAPAGYLFAEKGSAVTKKLTARLRKAGVKTLEVAAESEESETQTAAVSLTEADEKYHNSTLPADAAAPEGFLLAKEGDAITKSLAQQLRRDSIETLEAYRELPAVETIQVAIEKPYVSEVKLILNQEARPAQAAPILQGIKRASLSTDSFISAASFEETTRVLANAAAYGRWDALTGLKENLIMGRLIPAGTGIASNRQVEAQPVERVMRQDAIPQLPPEDAEEFDADSFDDSIDAALFSSPDAVSQEDEADYPLDETTDEEPIDLAEDGETSEE